MVAYEGDYQRRDQQGQSHVERRTNSVSLSLRRVVNPMDQGLWSPYQLRSPARR